METIEIRSSHDLTAEVPEARPAAKSAYRLSCRQTLSVMRDWERGGRERQPVLGLMTLGLERIWITEDESKQVVEAIRASRSPVLIE